jgi:two-component sensor histidine kinase
MKIYYTVKDSITAANQSRLAYAIESRYQLNEKNQTIQGLNLEAQLQAQRLKSSKQLQWILITGMILTAALTGLVFYFYRIKRKQTEELAAKNAMITKAYTEKDMLLREIHHRVKNNLQVVSSLLRLQSRHVSDNLAHEALLEGRNRVHSMALIHQYLYRDEDVTKISADDYIKKLTSTLYKSYHIPENQIKLETHIESVKLDVDTAIPLGLILNELITNVLKHAFPNHREGILEVSLLRGGNNEMTMKVRDNGIGFNHNLLKQKSESFGWSLVELFTEKLNGQLYIFSDNGTTIQLKFKEIADERKTKSEVNESSFS